MVVAGTQMVEAAAGSPGSDTTGKMGWEVVEEHGNALVVGIGCAGQD